jgi:hypothetical protein
MNYFFLQEFLKNTVDLLDLVGLHFVITRICSKTDLKYLVAAIGWASAELVVTKSVIVYTCIHVSVYC